MYNNYLNWRLIKMNIMKIDGQLFKALVIKGTENLKLNYEYIDSFVYIVSSKLKFSPRRLARFCKF